MWSFQSKAYALVCLVVCDMLHQGTGSYARIDAVLYTHGIGDLAKTEGPSGMQDN